MQSFQLLTQIRFFHFSTPNFASLFRTFAAIVFLSVFALHSLGKAAYVLYFYANRTAIAASFCENLDKGNLDCKGCCHLNKTLNNMDKSSRNDPVSTQNNDAFSFLWFLEAEFQGLVNPKKSTALLGCKGAVCVPERHGPVDVPPPERG